jgi:hypothetical protein
LEGVPSEIKREMDLLTEKDKLFEGIKMATGIWLTYPQKPEEHSLKNAAC